MSTLNTFYTKTKKKKKKKDVTSQATLDPGIDINNRSRGAKDMRWSALGKKQI